MVTCSEHCGIEQLISLKLTWHLKMDGWNTILSFWENAYFQGRLLLVLGSVISQLVLELRFKKKTKKTSTRWAQSHQFFQ